MRVVQGIWIRTNRPEFLTFQYLVLSHYRPLQIAEKKRWTFKLMLRVGQVMNRRYNLEHEYPEHEKNYKSFYKGK